MAIAVQGYYDGTGAPPNRHHGQIIGLAGYAAMPVVWDAFEGDWWKVLADESERPACRYLHMKEAHALRGEFSSERGWTDEKVQVLIGDLFNRCFSPRGYGKPISDVLMGAACSVDLESYERVCDELPYFADKLPEALCVDHVVSVALRLLIPGGVDGMHAHELLQQRKSVELFFDKGEPFRHQIQRVWEARPWHRLPWQLRLVGAIGTADRESSAALQAADYLAWHTNRYVTSGDGAASARAIASFSTRCVSLHYDYDELLKTAKAWRKDGGYDAAPEH